MTQNLLFRTSPSQSCDNTSLFISFANPFPTSRAQWERSANSGATWTPNPAANIFHPAQGSQVERYRTFFRIPAGITGTYDVIITGDKYDIGGDAGYLYYNDVFIARTGTTAPTTITLPITEGLHKLEWRHGISPAAGATAVGIAFNYANATLIDECCPTAIYKCGRVNYTPPCSFTPVVTQLVPTKATTIMTPTVLANPNGFTIQDLANTSDGNTGGTSWGGIMVPTDVDATGVVIRYTLPATFNRVIRVNLWNNGGGELSDGDGIDTATVTLRDAAFNVVFTGTINGQNGFGPDVLNVPLVNNVRYMDLSNITNLPNTMVPVAFIIWRNIQVESAGSVDITWTCGNFSVKAVINSPDGFITYAGGLITQPANATPATITFTSNSQFTGTIRTDRPNDFNTLNITNNSVITMSNTGVDTKWLVPRLTFKDISKPVFACKCPGSPLVWRNYAGEYVSQTEILEC